MAEEQINEADIAKEIKEKKERLNELAVELADMSVKYHQDFKKDIQLKEDLKKIDEKIKKKEKHILQEKQDIKEIEKQLNEILAENEQLRDRKLNAEGIQAK